MGNQQLLLLVLSVVVVGIATVAGIAAFQENKAKSQHSAAVDEALRIVSNLQAWKEKPGAFGGGDYSAAQDFAGATFNALGYDTEAGGPYVSAVGCYQLTGTAAGATLDIYLDEQGGACDAQTEVATVTVTGVSSQSISWAYP